MRGDLGFAHVAGGPAVQPAQEARHYRAVLEMGAPRTGKLRLVLQRLHLGDLAA